MTRETLALDAAGDDPSHRDALSCDPVGTPDELFAVLDQAVAAGALRRLDVAFARFVADTSAGAVPLPVLLAAALVAQVEGRGHSCLPLDDAAAGPEALLGARVRDTRLARLPAGAWPDTAAAWRDALRHADAVDVEDGTTPCPGAARPLVLAGPRLYLRRYRDHERRVAAQVLARAGAAPASAVGEPVADADRVRHLLDRMFGGPRTAADPFDWQRAACALALDGGFTVITGGPGTGKTYTAARLLALLFLTHPSPERLRIALAAPTGKAAARLKESIGHALAGLEAAVGGGAALSGLMGRVGAAKTLHALLGARPDTRRFRYHAGHPLEVDVLIVDEASMIHLEMMAAVLEALPPGARVVLLGDKDQLASVEAGAVLGDLCQDAQAGRYDAGTAARVQAATGQPVPPEMRDDHGPRLAQRTVMLRESRRFGGAIGQLARAVNEGRVADTLSLLEGGSRAGPAQDASAVAWWRDATPAGVRELALQGRPGVAGAAGGYAPYLQRLRERPAAASPADPALEAWAAGVLEAFDGFRVLAAVREGPWGVSGLNASIESALEEARWLSPRGEWYEGRPVIVTRNDPSLGVFNGDIGIALRVPGPGADGAATARAALRVFFPEGSGRVRSVSVGRLAEVETAFAMTVHKSQGSEFAHTVLVLPPEGAALATRELVYTGITRARQAFTLLAPSADGLSQAVQRTTRRASGLPAWWGGASA